MKKLKVIFFGTPDFAVASLDAINNSHHEVVGVVTAIDKASGRGQKIVEFSVKTYAKNNNIPVFQPEKLKNNQFLHEIKNLNADVFVVVAFRMMPEVLFSIPRLGTFNIHASLLPDYRGAAPINFAIINGEKKTGVTSFFINEKIDEGNILLQEETDISDYETAGSLHDKLMYLGADLAIKTLNELAKGTLKEKPQPNIKNPKLAHKIFKENTLINWNQNSKQIYDLVRGLSPYPSAFTKIEISKEIKSLKIFSGKYELKSHQRKTGEININKNIFEIFTIDGIFTPEEIQLEGKKRMNIKDFLNGLNNFDIKIV